MYIKKATPSKHEYLAVLDTISHVPKTIFFTGTLPGERRSTVAIVGTRKPTSYGTEVAHMLARDLAKKGVVIVSGLAFGIDAIAHRGALEVGGATIAVLAGSVERASPRTHQALFDQITSSGGAVLSEYEPPTEPRTYHFLARNRIVSGLSDAIIIVEASARSGTLSTAAHALEQGREVFVVPGNITSPLSRGCNALLKQGAHPVTCADDVLEIIAPQLLQPQTILPLGATPLESKLIELLQLGIRDGDRLCQLADVSATDFSQTLTIMELQGRIRALGGNQWTLR